MRLGIARTYGNRLQEIEKIVYSGYKSHTMAKQRKKMHKTRTKVHPLSVVFGSRIPEELVAKTAKHLHSNEALVVEMAAMRPGRDPTEHELAQARECEIETREDEEWQDFDIFDRFDETYGDLDDEYDDWSPHGDDPILDYANPHGLDWSLEPEGR